jgi:N-formylglutamate deformylase
MTRPILLHIPHASTAIPDRWRETFLLDGNELEREILVMTDRYTDELFDLGDAADRLVFPVSRLLVDVERFHNDHDEPMAEKGMGAVYTKTHDGRPLKSAERRGELMSAYYVPHHDALEHWAAESLEHYGRCLILDCHSFPSHPLPCDMSQSPDRPDICIGTSKLHSQPGLVAAARSAFEARGWSVKLDVPYFGTMVPLPYFGREPRLASVMVEVNRRLYLDETSGEKLGSFPEIKQDLVGALKDIVAYWSGFGND